MGAMAKQMELRQQLLTKIKTKQQQKCFKCGGIQFQRDCKRGSKEQSTPAKPAQMENEGGPPQT